MQLTHLTPYKCLQILYVLLRMPGTLAFFLVMNIMRALAPDFTFRMFKEKLNGQLGTSGFGEKLKSVEDMEYLFSLASVKVGRLCLLSAPDFSYPSFRKDFPMPWEMC